MFSQWRDGKEGDENKDVEEEGNEDEEEDKVEEDEEEAAQSCNWVIMFSAFHKKWEKTRDIPAVCID